MGGYQGHFSFGDDLTDHHVCPMEVCCLYSQALGSVPYNQACSPLCTIRWLCTHRRAHQVVYLPTETISLVGDVGIRQYHQVEAANIYCPDSLLDLVSLAVADV